MTYHMHTFFKYSLYLYKQLHPQTLIGASVSKLKSYDNSEVASTAKTLVKKWKSIAKQAQNTTTAAKPTNGNSAGKKAGQLKRMASAGSSELDIEAEWKGLPQLRINICKKLHSI